MRGRMDKQSFSDLYHFRTRYLQEFDHFFERLVIQFDSILEGKEINGSEKSTLKQYCILREIASLFPYVHHCDEKMLMALPAKTIKKCREIVDFFEQKNEEKHFNPQFFSEEVKSIRLFIKDYYLKLQKLISFDLTLTQEKPFNRQSK